MHKNQMDWYRGEVEALTAHNRALGAPMPKSLMFFHIPIAQYKTAWEAYKENGYKDTGEVQVHYGGIGRAACSPVCIRIMCLTPCSRWAAPGAHSAATII